MRRHPRVALLRHARGGRRRGGRSPGPPPASPVTIAVTALQATVGPSIVIRNQSQFVSLAEATAATAALLQQVNTQFALPPPAGWGIGLRSLRVEGPSAPAAPGEWVLLLSDATTAPALGEHDNAVAGDPLLYVFPALDRLDGIPWTVSASHEILETLVDAQGSLAAVGADGLVRALEVCDAVEQDVYEVGGVLVSNFMLPAWFEPSGGHFDFLSHVGAAGALLPGGYIDLYEGGQWIERTNGEKRAGRTVRDQMGISRGARRRARRLNG